MWRVLPGLEMGSWGSLSASVVLEGLREEVITVQLRGQMYPRRGFLSQNKLEETAVFGSWGRTCRL